MTETPNRTPRAGATPAIEAALAQHELQRAETEAAEAASKKIIAVVKRLRPGGGSITVSALERIGLAAAGLAARGLKAGADGGAQTEADARRTGGQPPAARR